MWKRGGELPELALAQIRDRVGYKSKPPHQRRMSIIAGRAPPAAALRRNGSSSVIKERPDTVFTVAEGDEEEEGDEDDAAASHHSDNHGDDSEDERPETGDADGDIEDNVPVESPGDDNSKKSQELNEEFRRLTLASRERELTRRRSLLAQLQNEEEAAAAVAAAEDSRRQSTDASELEQQKTGRGMWRRKSHATRSTKQVGDDSDFNANPGDVTAFSYGSSDEDSDGGRRRRLRVKTRVAMADPCSDLSDDESDREAPTDNDALDVKLSVGMTQQERDAAFQKLLTQYLGLLQCAPAEVARRLQVNS